MGNIGGREKGDSEGGQACGTFGMAVEETVSHCNSGKAKLE